jgi:hypothetical protein
MALPIIARTLLISALIFCARPVCAQDIRIAVAGAMTGALAEAGDEVKRGAELAAKDINAAGGVNGRKIVLSIEDDACDPKQAVSVANHIVGEQIALVDGHVCSGASISCFGGLCGIWRAHDDAGLGQFKANRRRVREGLANNHAVRSARRQTRQNGRRLDGRQVQEQEDRLRA